MLEKQLNIIMNKSDKEILNNFKQKKKKKLKKLYKGIQFLCISLIPITGGPIFIQLGISRFEVFYNFYSVIGIMLMIISLILIFLGIKKIGDYIFEK